MTKKRGLILPIPDSLGFTTKMLTEATDKKIPGGAKGYVSSQTAGALDKAYQRLLS